MEYFITKDYFGKIDCNDTKNAFQVACTATNDKGGHFVYRDQPSNMILEEDYPFMWQVTDKFVYSSKMRVSQQDYIAVVTEGKLRWQYAFVGDKGYNITDVTADDLEPVWSDTMVVTTGTAAYPIEVLTFDKIHVGLFKKGTD